MAAVTGATSIPVKPGRRKTGAKVVRLPEFSALTHPIGCLLIRTAGSYKAGANGFGNSTGILGFAIASGQNLATTTVSGQPQVGFYAAEQGRAFKIVLNTTWTGSALRGSAVGLSVTAGAVIVGTGQGASTCGSIVDAVDWDNGVKVQDGDVNPVVYFILADSAIANLD